MQAPKYDVQFLRSEALRSVVVKTFLRSRDQDRDLGLFRSFDRDRDLDKMNSSALESRDQGLEITSLAALFLILVTEHSLKGCYKLR